MYTSPSAMQRVGEEVERLVWPIDRDFEDAGRAYWVRPAEPVELTELEVVQGIAWPSLPHGLRYYTVVSLVGPGVRMREIFHAPDIGDDWRKMKDGYCQKVYFDIYLDCLMGDKK
jgi:hypothetical protein